MSLQQKKNKRDRAANLHNLPTILTKLKDHEVQLQVPPPAATKFCIINSRNATTKERVSLVTIGVQEGNTFSRLGNVNSKSTSGTNSCDSFL